MEIPTIDKMAEAARVQNFNLRGEDDFLPRPGDFSAIENEGLSPLRRALFVLMSRNARNAADFFQLPSERTVEIGFPVEL